jgi:hypothetical protein
MSKAASEYLVEALEKTGCSELLRTQLVET